MSKRYATRCATRSIRSAREPVARDPARQQRMREGDNTTHYLGGRPVRQRRVEHLHAQSGEAAPLDNARHERGDNDHHPYQGQHPREGLRAKLHTGCSPLLFPLSSPHYTQISSL